MVRLGVYFEAAGDASRFVTNDSSDYVTLAYDLRAAYLDPNAPMFAMGLFRTPAYPVFLAALLRPFGGSLAAPVMAQIVLGVLTIWLTMVLAARLTTPRAALVAGILLAVDPVSALYPCLLQPETLFVTLLVGGVLMWSKALESGSRRIATGAGLLLGLAALTRPIAVLLPLVIATTVFLRRGERFKALLAGSMLAGALLPMGGLVLKNQALTGSPTFTILGDSSLLDYRAAGALALDEGLSMEQARDLVWRRFWRDARPGMNVAELSGRQRAVAFEILSEHKVAALRLWVDGLARLFSGTGLAALRRLTDGAGADPGRGDALAIFAILALVGGYIAVGRGLLLLWRDGRLFDVALALGPVVYIVILSAGPEAYTRFRFPAMPFLAILAGHGLSGRWRR